MVHPTSSVTISAAAQSQTRIAYLTPVEHGKQAFNIAQNCLNSGDHEGAQRSLAVAIKSFGDALAQNKARPYGEELEIKAQLAQAYLMGGDTLSHLGNVADARAYYQAALQYGALGAEQKLASLQNLRVEREEVVIQVASGLAGLTVDGSGHVNYLHFTRRDGDEQLLAEAQKQQPSLDALLAVAPQVRAKGGRTVIQFATGAANITTSGENNKTTTIWGLDHASGTIPGPNPTNLG